MLYIHTSHAVISDIHLMLWCQLYMYSMLGCQTYFTPHDALHTFHDVMMHAYIPCHIVIHAFSAMRLQIHLLPQCWTYIPCHSCYSGRHTFHSIMLDMQSVTSCETYTPCCAYILWCTNIPWIHTPQTLSYAILFLCVLISSCCYVSRCGRGAGFSRGPDMNKLLRVHSYE